MYPEKIAFKTRVLNFWFPDDRWGSLDHSPAKSTPVTPSQASRWFETDKEFDEQIRTLFEQDLSRLVNEEYRPADALSHPEYFLACIIALDQFPRNIYRGDARAFAFDFKARELSEMLVTTGADKQLPYIERAFAYLPFEHSESLVDQDKSVALLQQLVVEAQADPMSNENVLHFVRAVADNAVEHRDIIRQFGRYPHRNAILKRESLENEVIYLRDGGLRFGQ